MGRMRLIVVSLVVVLSVLGVSRDILSQTGATIPGLSGTWRSIGDERDGVVDKEPSTSPWVVDAGTIGLMFGGATPMWRGPFTVNTKANPAEIDIDVKDAMVGGFKGKALGLFELKGDNLKICLVFNAESATSRPSRLSTQKGDKWGCHSLQRVRPAK